MGMGTKTNKEKRLNGKDLINIGIFTAIYFVIIFICAILGMIPIFVILIGVIAPILAGAPIMLFLTRVNKYGMIFTMSIIVGILMLFTGMGYYPLLVAVITGIVAELIFKAGKGNTPKRMTLTYAVFSLWCWGNYVLMFVNKEAYYETRANFGENYIDTLTTMTPMWLMYVLIPVVFISGVIGGVIGKAIMKKHFVKAGIV